MVAHCIMQGVHRYAAILGHRLDLDGLVWTMIATAMLTKP